MVQPQTAASITTSTCSACLRTQAHQRSLFQRRAAWRAFSAATRARDEQRPNQQSVEATHHSQVTPQHEGEQGAMSRRLAEMATETMNTGSKSDRKMMADAGFSNDLKQQLEQRIAQTSFQAEHQHVLSQVSLPSAAGKGTRDQAAAPIWTGTESLHDASLRMLDDSHKRLRMPARKPSLSPISLKPRPAQKISVADRLANARDKTSIYTQQQEGMTDEERAKFKQELKDRFQPSARTMPATLQGLTSLANERIEDAIARGQFKNIQRGKGVNIERDYTANSPFLDTTEYFMNKIIQKQEIVPPWIEKQQDLMKSINIFRQRMRKDWRRHAARTISSRGGTVDEQIRRAKAYALAEEIHNPRPSSTSETMSTIDSSGMLSSITIEQKIAAGITSDPLPDSVEIKVTETAPVQDAQGQPTSMAGEILAEGSLVISQHPAESTDPSPLPPPSAIQESASSSSEGPTTPITPTTSSTPPIPDRVLPMSHPFRDESWEKAEFSYQTLAIAELNALARSYNLMAPKIAQKPYYNLARELKRCYADVAPTVADEILNRSVKGPVRIPVSMHKEGSVMQRFQGTGHVATVRDEPQARGYGFKEFWKDLFGKDEELGEGRGRKRRDV